MFDQNLIKDFSIDKSSWKKVKLGDVVFEPKESTRDPVADGLENIVGLDHIDSEDMHLRRSENINKSTSFTKVFKEGDVLFGRRRSYLKKAAIAGFSGICSGDIIVMRTTADLLADFLPYLINNDIFFDFAIKHSAGGLSPRVKFKDLANFEFYLPNENKQLELLGLFKALDEVNEKNRCLGEKLKALFYSNSVRWFNNSVETIRPENIVLPRGWKLLPIHEIVPDIEYGISTSIPKKQESVGVKILSTAEVSRDGDLIYEKVRRVIPKKKLTERVFLESGDVIFNWRNSIELIGKSTIFHQPDEERYTFASFLLRLRCDEINAHNIYFKWMFNYYREVGVFIGMARKAVNQANFNKNEVLDLLVPVPSYSKQVAIAKELEMIQCSMKKVKVMSFGNREILNSLVEKVT